MVANDLQYYAYVINRAILSHYTAAEKRLIREKVAEYNGLRGRRGFIAQNYGPPKRMYFTRENAERIDAMRMRLEEDRPRLPAPVYFYLLASIIVAADKCANTSSVFASYLKEFKASALRPVRLADPEFPDVARGNRCFHADATTVAAKTDCDVVYLDPPYNSRAYSYYYHVLETIARYDSPKIHGKTGIPDERPHSAFSSAAEAEQAFRDLVANIKARVLILSYNDEGLLSHEALRKILRTHGRVKMLKIPYKKFKAQQGVDRQDLFEYLFVSVRNSE